MKIIIGGAGKVGFKLASFLSSLNNDITIIDTNPDVIQRINTELDANALCGSVSDPSTQEKAGARDAEIVISLTPDDELNMVACQVAHSLFGVPRKMARIRNPIFKDPEWSNLFSRDHMPIDHIISPENEVAKAIRTQLRYVGMTGLTEIKDGDIHLLSLICDETCPFLNTTLSQIPDLLPQSSFNVVAINRNDKTIFPTGEDQLYAGDEISILCPSEKTEDILIAFGHEQSQCSHNIIVGGGNIGRSVIHEITTNAKNQSLTIIEKNPEVAEQLSKEYEDVLIINGSGLNKKVIQEAKQPSRNNNIIVTTDDDETNILAPLLAQDNTDSHIVSLLNKDIYHDIMIKYPDISTVSPKGIVIRKILSHLQKGEVRSVHSSYDGEWQLYEVKIKKSSPHLNVSTHDLALPKGLHLYGILREGELILDTQHTILKPDDRLFIATKNATQSAIEKFFVPAYELI